MKALIIDTSHKISYIILTKNQEIIFFSKILQKNLSKELFTRLQDILQKTKTKLSKLKYIATSFGPGSFTGLRMGASLCKTLSYTKSIPLIGYVSLQAYIPTKTKSNFLSVFDAQSEGIYALDAKKKKNIFIYKKPQLLNFENAKKLIKKTQLVISPDSDLLIKKFKMFKNKFQKTFLNPLALIEITEQLFIEKKFIDYNSFNLLYLKGPNHVEQ